MKKILIYSFIFISTIVFGACSSEIEDGTTDIDSWPPPIGEQFTPKMVHPGVLHTKQSIEKMRDVVDAADDDSPAYKTYVNMKNNGLSKSDYTLRGPFEYISRDHPDYSFTKGAFEADFSAAYLNALMWAVTENEEHAEKTIEILVKYADKLKGIPESNDAPLLVGLQGFQIIYATEMVSTTYDKMNKDDLDKINGMIRNIFLPIMVKFYNTPPYTNGNWGIIVTKAYMAAAILWNDVDMYKEAVRFYLYGNDNGTINYVDGETGQNQESGRDQGHAQLGIGGMAAICELAYQQGNDLYGLLDNRLLKGYEYTAKYNLGYDVPYKVWKDVTGKYSNWSVIGSGGRGNFRAIYAMAYNHYVDRKGLSMPYTKEVLEEKQPVEGYDADNIGFGTFQFLP